MLAPELMLIIVHMLDYASRLCFSACSKYTRHCAKVMDAERLEYIMHNPLAYTVPAHSFNHAIWQAKSHAGQTELARKGKSHPGKDEYTVVTAFSAHAIAYSNRRRTHCSQSRIVWAATGTKVEWVEPKERVILCDGRIMSVLEHPVFDILVVIFVVAGIEYILLWNELRCKFVRITDDEGLPIDLVGRPYIMGRSVRVPSTLIEYVI